MTTSLLIFGLALLLAGGTALVSGASRVAIQFGVPPLVIGLTILAFGTSSPELVVNLVGAVRNETTLAFGNIAGSNLANLGLILGVSALARPVGIEGSIVRRELPLLLLGTVALLIMMLDRPLLGEPALLSRPDALLLLLLFGVFVYVTIIDLLDRRQDALIANVLEMEDNLPPRPAVPLPGAIGLIIGGIVGLALGGHLTIVHGADLAESLGVSPVIIGMLIVGVGTSLPELVTSVIAALRRESDLCVGNLVGSNIFNGLFILPVSALVRPLPIPPGGVLDIFMSLLFAAVIIPVFLFGRARMDRKIGFAFILVYVGYMSQRALG
ncbi:MAG: calcium/sodium antiporter [Halioglobus sp.]|nr:calcium/sodium antiporter [Halioglobus sp.]